MKSGGPLRRRTPLKRRPFKRTPSTRKRPSATKSKIPPKIRAAVEQRASMRCEVQANGHCEGSGYHCHHVTMRSHGGAHTVDNLLLTCRTCHEYVHHHPRLAYERGWLRRAVA